jgi:hypothetical protein
VLPRINAVSIPLWQLISSQGRYLPSLSLILAEGPPPPTFPTLAAWKLPIGADHLLLIPRLSLARFPLACPSFDPSKLSTFQHRNFSTEDGGSTFLRSGGIHLQVCTESQPRTSAYLLSNLAILDCYGKSVPELATKSACWLVIHLVPCLATRLLTQWHRKASREKQED